MNFEVFYPEHPLLKATVEYYYFARTFDEQHYSKYLSFPSTSIPVNIHKNVKASIDDNIVRIRHDAHAGYQNVINHFREKPLIVEWNGLIDKVTVSFKPIGLNYFMKAPLSAIPLSYTVPFTMWDEEESYLSFLDHFFTETANKGRVLLLENFLLQQYQANEKLYLLEQAINSLSATETNTTVGEICAALHIPERSFNRLFHLYTGISPRLFRKIARFRQSLKAGVNEKKLTNLAYEFNYYDQADFIKVYKSLSGKSPKNLYNAINKSIAEEILFEFEKIG